MDTEKYEGFLAKGRFYRATNFLIEGMGLLNLSDSEMVLLMYIHRWITLPSHHIYDLQVLRDLCWTRNKLLATRKSLVAKKYMKAEYENVFSDELGFKSTGYLYDLSGLYEIIYSLSELPPNVFLDARKEAYQRVCDDRMEAGRHLRFAKKGDESQDRNCSVPQEELDSSMSGTDQSHPRAPSKTDIIHNKNKKNTTEVEEPSAPNEEPKVPNEKEALPKKFVPLGFSAAQKSPDQSMRLSLDEIDDLEPSYPDDEDYDAMFEKEEAEYEARKKELENPTDIHATILRWFKEEMKSPDYYVPSFTKAGIPEEKLRQFWAIRDKWKTYPAIKKTDGSLQILIRNIDKFIETYWTDFQEQLEIDRASKEFQEKIWAELQLMDEYGIWFIRNNDFHDPDWIDYRNAIDAIKKNTWAADCKNPFYLWTKGYTGFRFRDGKPYICNREVVKGEFSKKAILAYIESLKKPQPAKTEFVPDAKFEEELIASLEEDE